MSTTRSSTGIKGKTSTQQPTKKTISKPSTVQDRPNSRVPSRIIVSNNPTKPKDVDNKPIKTTNVNSKVNVQTKTQTPTRPTIETRPKTKVISKTNAANTGAQNTGPKINERRLSRVETKTATKSRPTLSKTVIIQSENSIKAAVNGDKTTERAKTVNKRSIVVNNSSVSATSKGQKQQRQAEVPDTRSKIDQIVSDRPISSIRLTEPQVKEETIKPKEESKPKPKPEPKPKPKPEPKPEVEDSIKTDEEDTTTEADYSDDFEDYESDFEEYESQEEDEVKSTEVSLSNETNKSIDLKKVKLTALTVPSIAKVHGQNNQQPTLVASNEEAARIKWEITLPSPKVNINDEINENKESLQEQRNVKFKDDASDVANVLSRLLGPKNVKHLGSQTVEKSEASCQSDEIHVNNKSIQCPARSSTSNIYDQSKIMIDNNIDILRLSHFLEIGEKITKNLITSNTHGDQNKIQIANSRNASGIPKSDRLIISYQFPESYKTFQLNNLITDGRYVYAVTSYDFANGIYLGNSGSVVLIWSLLEPRSCEFMLFCKFMLTQIVTDNEFLVVAGSSDGSLIAWDLREPSHFHNQMNKPFLEFNPNHPLRNPSFTTAVGKHSDHHQDRILQLFYRYEVNDDTEARRIISLDELGKIIVWLIVESYADDHSSQQITDGLRPGSCVRLQIAMTLHLPNNYIITDASITCIDCSPSDSWNYLIGTNLGSILRYSKYLDNLSDPLEVVKYTYLSDEIHHPTTCVVYHPNPESDLFLAGYMDGSICIFSIKYEFPSRILLAEDTGYSTIVSSFWLSMDSELFLVLDHTKGISIRDAKGENQSLFEHQNPNERILFVTKSLINLDDYFLVYGLEDSSIVGLNLSNQILNC
ncbi:WD repeat-containing protein 60-like isoform X2 [Tetranychus urticae]|uniref:WD repeat-containing protein 60-like isoform X2 n=1 Tax=Tetranychus urticae TaxID=32264 RepID=UPI000D64C294|nr:WD repeat-containing protein 60-like isoform X2 [Tetranychus urticae]